VSQSGKPVIISSGMSSYQELDAAVHFLLDREVKLSILQCTTAYPTRPEHYGLNIIQELQKRYPKLEIGFSDHSGSLSAGIAAVTLGAQILEFHVVFHKAMFGPDVKASLTLEEATDFVRYCKEVSVAIAHPVDKFDNEQFSELKSIFEKSLAVNKDLPEGHLLTFEDLEAKKPKGYGMDANQFEKVIGQRLIYSMKAWSFLKHNNISW
jgi:N-acetylneuraminate synthase